MTTFSEQQWNATRMLLCTGDNDGIQHAAMMPRIRSEGGVTSSDLRCEWCGSPMVLVDVLVIDRAPTLLTLDTDRGAPLYTTAKLHPVAVIGALARLAGEAKA